MPTTEAARAFVLSRAGALIRLVDVSLDRTKEGQVEEMSRLGQQALRAQPFSALVGASLASFSEGRP